MRENIQHRGNLYNIDEHFLKVTTMTLRNLKQVKGWDWVNTKNDRSHFYKYMPLNTAFKVLESSRLRWSSPLLFNDPFDVPKEITFGFSSQQLFEAVKNKIISLIKTPPKEKNAFYSDFSALLNFAEDISDQQKDKLIEDIEKNAKLKDSVEISREEMRKVWREMLPELRILCLTESPKHSAMWYHYSDQYKGAVFEFNCSEDLDSPWLVARQVRYPEEKPSIYSLEGWTDMVLTSDPDNLTSLILEEAIYTKARDWSYENEWRISTLKRANETGLFSDYNFNPAELTAIYLGPLVSNDNIRLISSLTSAFSNVKLIKVNIGFNREFLLSDI